MPKISKRKNCKSKKLIFRHDLFVRILMTSVIDNLARQNIKIYLQFYIIFIRVS